MQHCANGVRWVSIHAPYIGSDTAEELVALTQEVSIHAPYIGSDEGVTAMSKWYASFNPRSLHRERLCSSKYIVCSNVFQSTLPT